MPTSAVALRLKKIRRRFGITAPRVAVRSHIAWQWYAAGVGVLVMLISMLAWSLTQRGEVSQLVQENRLLRQQLLEKNEELGHLRTSASTEHNVMQMERTSQQLLLSRIKVLEKENADLKEESVLFERLVKECPKTSGAGRQK